MLLAPARHHFDIFRHLADGRPHAALAHAMRAAEVQLHAIAFGFFNAGQNVFPGILVARHHQRHDHRAVRPGSLHRLDFAQVDFQIAVGDEFDIVEAQQSPVGPVNGAVARPVDVDDGRTRFPKRLPHDATPTRLEGPHHIVFLVGRRCRGEPKRIRRCDAGESRTKVSHGVSSR